HKVGSLALEFRSKGAALFGHLTPRSGEHSRLNGCPVSLDHYSIQRPDAIGALALTEKNALMTRIFFPAHSLHNR
ncbi:hypothetical protein, partial [Pseudomonas sp. PDM02]|uniref:hypothetical protein n=1 Tax=Pseudomonas sp. PDM02 TaxID=2769267 RepID=UPI001CE0A6AC